MRWEEWNEMGGVRQGKVKNGMHGREKRRGDVRDKWRRKRDGTIEYAGNEYRVIRDERGKKRRASR